MKKIFLIMSISFLMITNVNAADKYTDYSFVKYADECEDSETIKCEVTKFNKFYKENRVDGDYFEMGLNDYEFPYLDESDVIVKTGYSKYRRSPEDKGYKVIRIDKTNTIDSIKITLNSDVIALREIIVYKNNDILEYTTNNSMLNDGDLNTSFAMRGTTILNLSELVKFNDIRVKVLYDSNISSNLTLIMDYSYNGQSIMNTDIVLESGINNIYYGYLESSVFEEHIRNTGLVNESSISRTNVLKYYEGPITLYKYYNVLRDYYIDSEEEFIVGYIYDAEESYNRYKVYERSIIEETPVDSANVEEPSAIVNTPEILKTNLPKPLSVNTRSVTSAIVKGENKPVSVETNSEKVVTMPSKKIFTTSNSVKQANNVYASKNLKTTIGNLRKKVAFTVLFVILLILVIYTLHNKFRKK